MERPTKSRLQCVPFKPRIQYPAEYYKRRFASVWVNSQYKTEEQMSLNSVWKKKAAFDSRLVFSRRPIRSRKIEIQSYIES